MTWTVLSFPFGSVLTSAKMTQLYNNLTAVTQKDSGAPVLKNDYILAAMIANGNVSGPKLSAYDAGNYVEAVANLRASEIGDTTASYTKQLEIKIFRTGTITTRLGLRETLGSYNVVGKIYINGIAQGSERDPGASGTWQWWHEDFAVSAGDLIQLYMHRGGNSAERASAALALMCGSPNGAGALYTNMTELNVNSTEDSIYD